MPSTIEPRHTLRHNPGYDFVRLIAWLEELDPHNTHLPFAPYLISTQAVLAGCCAVEGYVSMIGQRVVNDWESFDRGPIPIKQRIQRLYHHLGTQCDFGEGIFQELLALFRFRNELAHPRFIDSSAPEAKEIETIFQSADRLWPAHKVRELAEHAINRLLYDSKLGDIQADWYMRTYSGPPREE